MMQVIEQTDEEKLVMYMKCSKKELAKMLIEANKHRSAPTVSYSAYPIGPMGVLTAIPATSIKVCDCGLAEKHTAQFMCHGQCK